MDEQNRQTVFDFSLTEGDLNKVLCMLLQSNTSGQQEDKIVNF